MKNTLHKIILPAFAIAIAATGYAQDERFSQSYADPLQINPAIMGANHDIKFGMNYRSQWAFIDKGYKTYSVTAMCPMMLKDQKGKFDAGVNVMNDKAGAFTTTNLALALDYSKEISPNNNLCLSLMGGYIQKSIDIASQTFDAQYVNGKFDATNPANEALSNKVSHQDIGFGFTWFYNPNRTEGKINAYLGIAGYHLNEPHQSLLGAEGTLPMRFSYQAGIRIFGQNKFDLSPSVRVNNQNGNVEPAAGLYAEYSFNPTLKFVIGGWYRVHDANAIVVGFTHTNFTLGYSYDMLNNGLNDARGNVKAHELSLSIKINRGPKANSASTDEVEKEILKDAKQYSDPFMAF
ncbi:MAG: PorP/SprF family type IX secretion system membrane protein [Bacteroidia bacterium]